MRQARRKFYGDTPAGIELGGYPGELVHVTPQSLKAEYDRILSTASIDVMVQGVDEARVADLLLKKLEVCTAIRSRLLPPPRCLPCRCATLRRRSPV